MIDPRFGMHYRFPHSLVHIVDNSDFRGQRGVIEVADPSLYSCLVVTASPLGVDNRITTITRSDVCRTAFGLGSIDESGHDGERFGQTIGYPISLLEQGAPVRMLRVTPEGSTYGLNIIVIQWRREYDGDIPRISVRFQEAEFPPNLRLDRFANPERLNAAIINQLNVDGILPEDDGYRWKQRVFMNNISAGRGSGYNRFATAINPITQGRRPANIGYNFITINTDNNRAIERYMASLVNVDNAMRPDSINTVNAQMAQRMEGSSIIKNFLNEQAVQELYGDYMETFKEVLETTVQPQHIHDKYRFMNVNIFDAIYGKYIVDGNEGDIDLPFYQVDKFRLEIPKLPISNRITIQDDNFVPGQSVPNEIFEALEPHIFGVTRPADTFTNPEARPDPLYVGDLFLNPRRGGQLPLISMVVTINQYSGNVTSLEIPDIRPLRDNGSGGGTVDMGSTSVIRMTFNDVAPDALGLNSHSVRRAVQDRRVDNGDIIAYIHGSTFQLFTVRNVNVTTGEYAALAYTQRDLYRALYFESIPNANLGNIIGRTDEDAAYHRPGGTVIHDDGRIFVNGFLYDPNITGAAANQWPNRFLVLPSTQTSLVESERNGVPSPFRVGQVPQGVSLPTDFVGTEFDMIIHPTDADTTYAVDRFVVTQAGSNWHLSDEFELEDGVTRFRVTDIGPGGAVRSLRVINRNAAEPEQVLGAHRLIPVGPGYIPPTTNYVGKFPTNAAMRAALNNPSDPGWNTDQPIAVGGFVLVEADETITTLDNPRFIYELVAMDWTNDPDREYRGTFATVVEGMAAIENSSWDDGDFVLVDGWNAGVSPNVEAPGMFSKILVEVSNDAPTPDITVDTYALMLDQLSSATDGQIIQVLTDEEHGDETTYWTVTSGSTDVDRIIVNDIRTGTFDSLLDQSDLDVVAVGPETDGVDYVHINVQTQRTIFPGHPTRIWRYIVNGVQGSIYRLSLSTTNVPANYYTAELGINMTSQLGGVRITRGSTGFFDDRTMHPIIFKWRYSELLVRAYEGLIDPRILSPNRCVAKFLFDGGTNTIFGQVNNPHMNVSIEDIVAASTIFTEEEKELVMLRPEILAPIVEWENIDVKEAMYKLMIERIYQGLPEHLRENLGPGSGMSLHLDSGITDGATTMLLNSSFVRRFNNPNASWDIGGFTMAATGRTYTFVRELAHNLIRHIRTAGINKPYAGETSGIVRGDYVSFFPDIDTTDWELRELHYMSGGNIWIPDHLGTLTRRSQRTLWRDAETSDLVQESNMRTLTRLVYLLQNKIDSYLLEYNDDGVIQTLTDEVNMMFARWIGRFVDGLQIHFERDINVDGGEILVCYCNVVFRGLILRVPIIVNVNRRDNL